MFFIISKALKMFLMPSTWLIGMLLGASVMRNKRWKHILIIASLVMLAALTNKPLYQFAEYQTTKHYHSQVSPSKHYKVAIIMGGFGKMNKENGQFCSYKERGSRLWEPIRLYHMGIVDKLLITGDATVYTDPNGESALPEFKTYLQELGIPDTNLLVEPKALNTRENALFSIAMLDSLGYKPKDCILITSASHMKRSADCFGHEGWSIDQFPVNCQPKPSKYKVFDFIPTWEYFTEWNTLINEWLGNIIYPRVGYKQ